MVGRPEATAAVPGREGGDLGQGGGGYGGMGAESGGILEKD